MKKTIRVFLIVALLLVIFIDPVFAVQIDITRVEQMPNILTPYQMRDWKQVAADYDNFEFDFNILKARVTNAKFKYS